jgi:hypothetical protein
MGFPIRKDYAMSYILNALVAYIQATPVNAGAIATVVALVLLLKVAK